MFKCRRLVLHVFIVEHGVVVMLQIITNMNMPYSQELFIYLYKKVSFGIVGYVV